MKNKIILCVSPHADDFEHGCGGSILRFIEEGNEIFHVSFTFSKKSIPVGFSKDITEKEFSEAMLLMGIKNSNITTFDYPVREFPTYRQNILDDLVKINNAIKPDLVFIPSSYDLHQDHNTIFNEGVRAFKKSCILGYEMPRNNFNFNMGFFITVTEKHIKTKIKAIECYKSQSVKSNYDVEFLLHLSKVRGAQIGTDCAECFEPIRYIMKDE